MIPIATLENPVELPVSGTIAADAPIKSGRLVLYNWADYIHKKVVAEFEEEYGVDVEITTSDDWRKGSRRSRTDRSRPTSSCDRRLFVAS